MPPKGKKKGRNPNNKKKGKSSVGPDVVTAEARGTDQLQDSGDDSVLKNLNNFPTFHGNRESKDGTSTSLTSPCHPYGGGGEGGMYEHYKACTRKFRDWMRETVSQMKFRNKMTSVNDLAHGADQILEQNKRFLDAAIRTSEASQDGACSGVSASTPVVANKEVMESLSTSIRLRELYAQKYKPIAATDDSVLDETKPDGHQHIINALKYCRKQLILSRRIVRVAVHDAIKADATGTESGVGTTTSDMNVIGGRFNALLLDENDDIDEAKDAADMGVTDESIRRRQFPVVERPVEPGREISIEDELINGDDRFQAVALLNTMEDLMGAVDQHYGLLKRCMCGEGLHGEGSTVQLMLECAVVVNMATESVLAAERALEAHHPHMNSFYRLLALVFLSPVVADVQKLIKPGKVQNEPHLALGFVADIMECAFHNRGQDRIPGKVRKFVKRSGVPYDVANKRAEQIHFLTNTEVMIPLEARMNASAVAIASSLGIVPHSWFSHSPYIGGDRCILNTQKITQMIFSLVQDQNKLIGKEGYWGALFNERNSPATRIRGDLDEAFAANILPELLAICLHKPFKRLPERAQLLTVLDLLSAQLQKNRDDPIPIALSFGLHAMLTSILVVQGEGHLAQISTSLKASFEKLFTQLEARADSNREPQNHPNFYVNVRLFKTVKHYASPVGDVGNRELLSIWNPVIGGSYLLYGTYMCSIGLGSATVDSLGQLRCTLHIYNALKKQQLIKKDDVPFLRDLDETFNKCKAVWVGSRPSKGNYAKLFLVAWGNTFAEASRMVSEANSDPKSTFVRSLRPQGLGNSRKLDEILPDEYSASYKRVVQRNFTEGDADYSILNGTPDTVMKFHSLVDLLYRVNMARDSMDEDDGRVTPINFTEVGCILLEFGMALNKHLNWDGLINGLILGCPDEIRNGRRADGRLPKIGGFETSDLNLYHQAQALFVADFLRGLDQADKNELASANLAAEFMIAYFKSLSRDGYTFFVEPQSDGRDSLSRNPLIGNYPTHANGTSPQTPLYGFIHCKYSKAGKPSVRVVKSGKYTPLALRQNGEIGNPYPGGICGNKLERQPNGRFRHIASYALEELIQLGWDGAMYVSSRGRHEATGMYVPFVPGYDSDEDDTYNPIDVEAARRAGILGLPEDEGGRYMYMHENQSLGRLQQGSAFERRFGRSRDRKK